MASIIDTAINTGSFELVRDRIAAILADELLSQATIQSDSNLAVKGVYIERFVPFSHTDCPSVNVSLNTGEYSSFTRLRQDGTYQFFIDVYEKSPTTTDNRGDKLANIKLQKLANVCRGILSHPKYNTLAFEAPFIEHTEVKSIGFGAPNSNSESENMVMARMIFEVRVPENSDASTPLDIAGYTTKAVLGITDKGYLYGGDAYLPPVTPECPGVDFYVNDIFQYREDAGGAIYFETGTCADATVTVNGDEFATVESGGTLPVTVEYETSLDNPIASVSGSNIIIVDPVVVSTNRIYLRPSPTGEIYDPSDPVNYPDGCDSWRVITGQDISSQPSSGTIMYLDRSDVSKVVPDNIFGHKFKITGLTGGYFDADTGNYHDADGTVSDRATAFPLDYFINHHTGEGGTITANGSNVTWQTALDEIDALSFAGFDDYFLPNLNELLSIVNYGYSVPLAQSTFPNALPPFDLTTNGSKWTGTTYKGIEERAWTVQTTGDPANNSFKTSLTRYMAFRYHFNNI